MANEELRKLLGTKKVDFTLKMTFFTIKGKRLITEEVVEEATISDMEKIVESLKNNLEGEGLLSSDLTIDQISERFSTKEKTLFLKLFMIDSEYGKDADSQFWKEDDFCNLIESFIPKKAYCFSMVSILVEV